MTTLTQTQAKNRVSKRRPISSGRFHRWKIGAFGILCVLWTLTTYAEKPPILPDSTELLRPFSVADTEAFQTPAKVHYPETWFHYIGGNVSFEGITADLEAIAAADISGIQLFHGQFGGPWPETTEQIPCLSPKWDAAVQHTAQECRRLGLRFTMQNCPGWAMSGGPWIEPKNAMRQLVWSRTDVEVSSQNENGPIEVLLPKPAPSDEDWRDYHEITVLAFPTPLENDQTPLTPVLVTSDQPELPWMDCITGNAAGTLNLAPTDETNPHWVEMTFPSEVTLRTVELPSINSFLHAFCYDPGVTVTVEQVLADRVDSERVLITRVELPQASWQDSQPISLACDETRGTTYRISIVNLHPMQLNTLRLFSAAKANNWESEAGWTLRGPVREGENPRQSPEAFIDIAAERLLPESMDSDGRFCAELPPGRWTILRVGHVNAGERNAPAPPEGTGWECNKLSPVGADAHFAGYIGRLTQKDGPLEGLLDGVLLDSWECRTQTWTSDLDTIFENRLGYSPLTYLPAVLGYVVQDHETTHRFLRDWRGTIGDLFANQFYGRMAENARRRGLSIQYETAAGDIFPADILEYYKYADVPMCEFWQPLSEGFVGSLNFKPIKPTASAARIYGKPRVSAESFTSFELTWDERWESFREVFHRNAVEGVTHVIFHTCTHQPQIDFLPPGTSMGSGIGTPFVRGQTWWSYLPEFTGYLARCSFLLERGRPVSDVLWYLGDEIRHKPDQTYPFPSGFKYDYCNPDVLLNRLTVTDGDLTTPEGIRYRVLWLADIKRMLPETLEKLQELVESGATVIGNRPQSLATLSGGEDSRNRFERARQHLWGDGEWTGRRNVGRGTVVAGLSLEESLELLGLEPDLRVETASSNEATLVTPTHGEHSESVNASVPGWVHRQIDGANWYFVSAPIGGSFHGDLSFRNGGPIGEIWNPVTGDRTPIATREENGRTTITLELPTASDCFVVFLERAISNRDADSAKESYQTVAEIPCLAPWTLTFPAGWGVEAPVTVDSLMAWKDLPISDEGRAFSGTVHYETTFTLSEDQCTEGTRLTLEIGALSMIAAVRVNGEASGTIWTSPHEVEVTNAVRPGKNRLEMDVTSTWFNRLVYDANQPAVQRKTWTISGPAPTTPLRTSGLLGPVFIRAERK